MSHAQVATYSISVAAAIQLRDSVNCIKISRSDSRTSFSVHTVFLRIRTGYVTSHSFTWNHSVILSSKVATSVNTEKMFQTNLANLCRSINRAPFQILCSYGSLLVILTSKLISVNIIRSMQQRP